MKAKVTRILTINSGSSSLKFGLYRMGGHRAAHESFIPD